VALAFTLNGHRTPQRPALEQDTEAPPNVVSLFLVQWPIRQLAIAIRAPKATLLLSPNAIWCIVTALRVCSMNSSEEMFSIETATA
jgi:hypothetical protein